MCVSSLVNIIVIDTATDCQIAEYETCNIPVVGDRICIMNKLCETVLYTIVIVTVHIHECCDFGKKKYITSGYEINVSII